MNHAQAAQSIRQFGFFPSLADLTLRGANRMFSVRILKGLYIDRPDLAFLECDAKYRGGFLDAAQLRDLARDPANELSSSFLDEALAKGDRCYGFLAGDTLAAYGWYSAKPTAIDLPGLVLSFDPRWVYMYKGFTRPDHRGQRLHAIGMTRALVALQAEGYAGIVSYVEWNNFASLRSCYRMGYRDFGTVSVAKLGGRFRFHSSAGCDAFRFRLSMADQQGATS
ncbi:MAG TPA: GNAT family acetyltransferase [bacterium]|nr:GNAT family acetyltransferase [bacterium]